MSGNKRRMNMLLASFYGMQQDTAQRQVDELDMDSAAFQPTAYVQKRLREDPLPELVALTKSLGNETKGLDSGVQNLVYENYSKFISATDTIRCVLLLERVQRGPARPMLRLLTHTLHVAPARHALAHVPGP